MLTPVPKGGQREKLKGSTAFMFVNQKLKKTVDGFNQKITPQCSNLRSNIRAEANERGEMKPRLLPPKKNFVFS
jgi:hypothetical protein